MATSSSGGRRPFSASSSFWRLSGKLNCELRITMRPLSCSMEMRSIKRGGCHDHVQSPQLAAAEQLAGALPGVPRVAVVLGTLSVLVSTARSTGLPSNTPATWLGSGARGAMSGSPP